MNIFSRIINPLLAIIAILIICAYIVAVPLYVHIKLYQPPQPLKEVDASNYVTRNSTQLQLFGQPYTFTGINAYSAATLRGANAGCGEQINNLDALFSSLRPNSIVRIWGWQGSMVTNIKTKQLDWSGLDRVISAADRQHQRLLISLGDQAGTCDDGLWKDSAWYNDGFKQVHNANGMTPLSYWDFVQQVVTRYKGSTTIAMWELMNEPEAPVCDSGYSGTECIDHLSCPDSKAAAKALRYFFDTVGGKIKHLDPYHLIESGVIGTGQCGADNINYQYIHESPYIDVASYHDYDTPDDPIPGDQWNGLQVRLNQMKTIQKPLIIGEVGINAQNNINDCMSLVDRSDKMLAKMYEQFSSGVAGFLPWDWTGENTGDCNNNFAPNDPLMILLREYPLQEITPPPTISINPTISPDKIITPTK